LIIDHKGDVLPENFWSTQPLTQMSTRVISWGWQPCHRADCL